MTTTTNNDILPVVVPADWVTGPPQGQWTYDDYAALPDDGNRYEIIQGVLYLAPSPSFWHQSSNMRFGYYLFENVELAGLGVVLQAPMDVVLAPNLTVQPDVVVVLNSHLHRIQMQMVKTSQAHLI